MTESANDFFKKLELFGQFIYTNGLIYLHTDKPKKSIQNKLKSKSSESQLFVTEVTAINLNQQPDKIKEWIKVKLFEEEKIRFEKENQEALKEFNDLMNDLEKELISQLNRKEDSGGS